MIMLETSINIEENRRKRFLDAACRLGLKQSELLAKLLEKSRFLFGKAPALFKTVTYQRSEKNETFKILHISVSGPDYEYVSAKRYLFKISVSFIVRLAIDRFLDQIERGEAGEIGQANSFTTNFFFEYFDISHFECSKVEFWVIPWAKPEKDPKTVTH